ncbi:hypothetical protein FACS189490_12430 [Clostridia bacterium]|nr:hypothetical protein FACS189490_12430 [Clostridia bacterium]
MQADTEFLQYYHEKSPNFHLTLPTLYRKWKSFKENGATGLLDMRGRHGNHKGMQVP